MSCYTRHIWMVSRLHTALRDSRDLLFVHNHTRCKRMAFHRSAIWNVRLNLLLQCSQTYDLSLVCVLIWLARPPFRALRNSHWSHANGFSPHRSQLYGFSPARHLMWWNYSKWNNTSDEGHAHPEPPPRCWPLKFTILSYKSWIRSWYNCYANIPMLFIVHSFSIPTLHV